MFSSNHASALAYRVRVWDLPTRWFHWLLASAFLVAWLSQGDSRYVDIHVFVGYLFFGLLVFRLIWGIVGTQHACFRNFAFGGHALWHYLITLPTKQRRHFLGHNPAGSWAIFGMLGFGLIIAVSGILTLGGENQQGPVEGIFNFAQGETFHLVHKMTAWIMLALIAVHISGVIIASVLHRENLIRAMVTGVKQCPTEQISVAPQIPVALVLLVVVVISAGGYFRGYLMATPDQPYLPFVGPTLPSNASWQEECDDCHLAYHPSLLPKRSWEKLLATPQEHFEENLALAPETIATLRTFALNQSAETAPTKTAWKIYRTTPASESPLRITETSYWQQRHQRLPEEVWKHSEVKSKANCDACHFDASSGTFEASAMVVR